MSHMCVVRVRRIPPVRGLWPTRCWVSRAYARPSSVRPGEELYLYVKVDLDHPTSSWAHYRVWVYIAAGGKVVLWHHEKSLVYPGTISFEFEILKHVPDLHLRPGTYTAKILFNFELYW